QTPPLSGFLLFFRFPGSGVGSRRSRVLTCFLCTGANPTWLHQTRLEAPSPRAWRVQRTVEGILCDLEIILCPHAGLFKRLAEQWLFASEGQARGRGSTRVLCATPRRMWRRQSGGPIKRQGSGIPGLGTPWR